MFAFPCLYSWRGLSCLVLVAGLLASCQEQSRFERLSAADTGITFANTISETDTLNILSFEYIYNGGGVGIGDVNNDGLPDVFFSGNQVSNRLYLNRSVAGTDKLHFEDITERVGLRTTHLWSTGVSLVDINADGLLDIYVCTINPQRGRLGTPNLFYLNQGIGKDGLPHFREMARDLGLDDRGYSTQAAFFDYDRDGDVDMYLLTNALEGYNRNEPRGPVVDGSGRSTDRLYRNEGQTRSGLPNFTDVSRQAGITVEGWGLGVAIADFNEDGWPDVYCANDFQSNDLLWINNQDGTFSNQLGNYTKHQSHNAMGVDVADLNNDGHPELMTLDMMPEDNRRQKSMFMAQNVDRFELGLDRGYLPQYVRNVLQLNQGPDAKGQFSFSEVGQLAGVSNTDWSWSVLMADFDNDGLRDIFVTNGYRKDITDLDFMAYNDVHQSGYFKSDAQINIEDTKKTDELLGVEKSNFMFHNRGDMAFEDVSEAWGLSIPSFSNGAAYADLDNDGDLDLVVNNIDEAALVYRNTSTTRTANANFLRVRLLGEKANSTGLGAKVEIRYGGQLQTTEQSPYRGYKSSVEPTLHLGLGKASRVDTLLVQWSDGRMSRMTNIAANQIVTVNQRDAVTERPTASVRKGPALFSELRLTNPVSFVQQENEFVDFKQQVLLPHRYSQGGPGLAVGDVDGNGLDDVFVGGASTYDGTLFRQTMPGAFRRQPLHSTNESKLAEDMGAVFFDADADNDLDLYVVSGGNEWVAEAALYQDRLYINDGLGNFSEKQSALPDTRASGSCVVAADYDRDGDIDLFVGGRVVPRQYPLLPRSYLLENNSGKFTDVTDRIAPGLANIGMVTSALWSDYDNDGRIDLVVAGEFMPVTLFKNAGSRFNRLVNPALDAATGWWNSLTAGDFDNDGDIDYVAGNLGLNSRYKVSAAEPLTVHAKDFDQNGTIDPIQCSYIQGKCYPAHPRDQLAEQVPSLKRRFPSYDAYGQMTFAQLLTPAELQGSYLATVTEFRSCYIENKGKAGFVIHALPMQAQLAPVFSMLTDDYDKDGNMDLLLVGNSYATDVQVGRYDASKGLLLKGNGRGSFRPLSMANSGLCADRNAKSLINVSTGPDQSLILVGNNGDTLQTFRQELPLGRSVDLRPDEYVAFWKSVDGKTHRVEVYAGSGYLSQSSRRIRIGSANPVTILNYRGQRRTVRPQ